MSTNTNSLVLDEVEEVEPEKETQFLRLVERTRKDEKHSAKEEKTIFISGRITVSF